VPSVGDPARTRSRRARKASRDARRRSAARCADDREGALKRECYARALIDSTLGVELARNVGTADQREWNICPGKRVGEVAPRLLPGAHDNRVDIERYSGAVDTQVQAAIVDALVRDARDHFDATPPQKRPANPPGRLREILADL